MREIHMVEPIDPAERAAAIRICRLNNWLDPDTGRPLANRDDAERMWHDKENDLPYSKWIWMWNHGRAEWDPSYQSTSASEGSK
jgi:hypothetical protein